MGIILRSEKCKIQKTTQKKRVDDAREIKIEMY
jgi:hypothetical protein